MASFIPDFTVPGTNRRLVLARRPTAHPNAQDMAFDELARPTPGPGEVLVRNIYLSADPVQRGWAASLPIGEVVRGLAVGVVIESRNAAIAEGSLVSGIFGWQDYCVPGDDDILSCVSAPVLPASAYAGILGMPGVTAWLALKTLAPLARGQRVLVSTAAGAVGSLVGQLASHAGAVAIGLTGSEEKARKCCSSFGYTACANYKSEAVDVFLKTQAGDGFNTYFDNTGGWILDAAIRHMARHGRIVQCGTAATPNWFPIPKGLRNEREILMRALTWSGFVIFDHRREFGAAVEQLSRIVTEQEIRWEEDIDTGFDKARDALDAVFEGRNAGKKLIYIG